MATELSGRALDEAAARAMGWTFVTFPDGPCPEVKHWKHPVDDEYHWRPTPLLSTDPACIDEMLAWLRSGLPTDEDLIEVDIDRHAKVVASFWVRNNGAWVVKSGVGSTIQQALARLVVAVKEAQP